MLAVYKSLCLALSWIMSIILEAKLTMDSEIRKRETSPD